MRWCVKLPRIEGGPSSRIQGPKARVFWRNPRKSSRQTISHSRYSLTTEETPPMYLRGLKWARGKAVRDQLEGYNKIWAHRAYSIFLQASFRASRSCKVHLAPMKSIRGCRPLPLMILLGRYPTWSKITIRTTGRAWVGTTYRCVARMPFPTFSRQLHHIQAFISWETVRNYQSKKSPQRDAMPKPSGVSAWLTRRLKLSPTMNVVMLNPWSMIWLNPLLSRLSLFPSSWWRRSPSVTVWSRASSSTLSIEMRITLKAIEASLKKRRLLSWVTSQTLDRYSRKWMSSPRKSPSSDRCSINKRRKL